MKNSKELEDITKALSKWIDKHKGEVHFVGSFMAFKGKDCKVVDDLIIGYGSKTNTQIALDEMNKMVKKEKEDFINW